MTAKLSSKQPIRTLIVDDEARIRRGIERLVLSCGEDWEVVGTLGDGREALDYLHANRGGVDLLITDVKMPEMDGLKLIREAKKEYRFYPVLISGYDDFEYVQTALREGAVDYLLKPVDREQFRERMAEIGERIAMGRTENRRLGETQLKAEKLKIARQTQLLSYVTSAGIDTSRLGYWTRDFPQGSYLLLYASLDSLPVKSRTYTSKDWEAYTFALENIVAEVVGRYERANGLPGWSWRGGNSDFWILLKGPSPEHESESKGLEAAGYELSEQVRSAVSAFTPFTISIAMADAIEDLYLLPDARRQALSLLHYRLLDGGNRVFVRREPANAEGSADRLDAELPQLAARLKQAIAQANEEEAEALLRLAFEELGKTDSPAAIRNAAQKLLIQIYAASLDASGGEALFASDTGGAEPIEQAIRSLDDATRLTELRIELSKRVRQAISGIHRARSASSRKPVDLAKAWIQDHLGGDLTIKLVADRVHMNPTYFCEYFKMQTGETVLDYITRRRMERAGELLLSDPAVKLADVCVQVGYQDVKYFSKLFKQWAGVSPSKYRDRNEGSCRHGQP